MNTANAKKSSGFTLIELMVVVSIIAVLIALALPVMARARDAAREVVCASMLRQVGVGISAYIVDANQHLPYVVSALWTSSGELDWAADPTDAAAHPHEFLPVMRDYLSRMKTMVCPNALAGYPKASPEMTYRVASANNYDGKVGPVFYNGNPTYGYSLKYLDGRRYEVKHVSYGLPRHLVDGPGLYYLLRDFTGKNADGKIIGPHADSVNQLYLDMHVSHFSERKIFGLSLELTYP